MVAFRCQIVFTTFAHTLAVETISGGELWIAATLLANIDGIEWHADRAKVSVLALVTIDAGRAVLAILANTTANIDAIDVDTLVLRLHLFVVVALLRVSIAVALFAHKRIVERSPTPFVLSIAGATLFTLIAASVVLTAARHFVGVRGRSLVTLRGMSVAHTSATDVDVLHTVEILCNKQN